jgi:prefoldin beta subunit
MTEQETQKKISQLQLMEQNLQALLSQRQQFQQKVAEINSALDELEKTEKSYKIIGNIMVLKDNKELSAELTQKKDMLEIRIKNVEKQELQIRTKAKKLQEEVLEKMK